MSNVHLSHCSETGPCDLGPKFVGLDDEKGGGLPADTLLSNPLWTLQLRTPNVMIGLICKKKKVISFIRPSSTRSSHHKSVNEDHYWREIFTKLWTWDSWGVREIHRMSKWVQPIKERGEGSSRETRNGITFLLETKIRWLQIPFLSLSKPQRKFLCIYQIFI